MTREQYVDKDYGGRIPINPKGRFRCNMYHVIPSNLIDRGSKVSKQFHIEEIPKTFVYGRDGKLIAVAIDQHTRKQFLRMLSNTDLRP